MISHSHPPIDKASRIAKFSETLMRRILSKLHKKRLVKLWKGHYEGVDLTWEGYDVLALNALSHEVIEGIGPFLGVGKESDVFRGITEDGKEASVKIHRLGKADFRATKRARSYIADRRHISRFYESRLAAEREYQALSLLTEDNYVRVPEPFGQNRHIVVMDLINGDELVRVKKLDPMTRWEVFDDILNQIERIFVQHHIIHGDLSEFNVMLDMNLDPYLIDWPQFETWDHPQATELLLRDVNNINNYFSKQFGVSIQTEKFVNNLIERI